MLVLLARCGGASSPGSSAQSGAKTPTQSSVTQQPGAYTPGTLVFYGTVRQVSASSITVAMPDGHDLVMNVVSGRTDLSRCGNALPRLGQVIEAHATATSNGNFTANSLAFADMLDQHERAQVEYHGATTSAVGSDNVLHFQVGTMRFSFPINSTAHLDDFNHHAQSIGAHQQIDAHVRFQGVNGTVIEVDHWDGH